MNKIDRVHASIYTETNRLHDAEALISAAIAMVDADSQEGNEIFRVLVMAKRVVTDVAVGLDTVATDMVRP